MRSVREWAFCLMLFACCGAAGGETRYTFTDLGTLGGPDSEGNAINNSGVVAGSSTFSGELGAQKQAFSNDGTMHHLGTLGGALSIGKGINDHGVVVGLSFAPNVSQTAFLYDGSMHDLGSLGMPNSVANAINNSGQVVGDAVTSRGRMHPFLFDDGVMYDLFESHPGSGQAYGINNSGMVIINADDGPYAYTPGNGTNPIEDVLDPLQEWQALITRGLNDAGHIVGNGRRHGSQRLRAFLYDGTTHDLGTLQNGLPPITDSIANDVNSNGTVVGYVMTPDLTTYRAFVYTRESGMVDLNTLADSLNGSRFALANAINDAGQITGIAFQYGHQRAFLLTPIVPEPGTFTLCLIATAVTVFWRNR